MEVHFHACSGPSRPLSFRVPDMTNASQPKLSRRSILNLNAVMLIDESFSPGRARAFFRCLMEITEATKR